MIYHTGEGQALMATDKFQQRMLASFKGRHLTRARQEVEAAIETAGWLLRDLDKGQQPRSDHARTLLASAQEIVTRLTALEAFEDAAEIYEAEAS